MYTWLQTRKGNNLFSFSLPTPRPILTNDMEARTPQFWNVWFAFWKLWKQNDWVRTTLRTKFTMNPPWWKLQFFISHLTSGIKPIIRRWGKPNQHSAHLECILFVCQCIFSPFLLQSIRKLLATKMKICFKDLHSSLLIFSSVSFHQG